MQLISELKQRTRRFLFGTNSHSLNTAFYLPFGLRETDQRSAEAALIQDLICYDRVWILSDQLSAVGMLAGILGPHELEEGLSRGAIGFIHDRNLLGWPKVPNYFGPTPVLGLASMPSLGSPKGFTQMDSAELAMVGLHGFPFDNKVKQSLAQAAGHESIDFGIPIVDVAPTRKDPLIEDLDIFETAIPLLEDFPLTRRDLRRLKKDLKDNKRRLMNAKTWQMVRVSSETGWGLFKPTRSPAPKQLALLNLFLSNRFLAAHATLGRAATVHTEPIVEAILRARLANVRNAPGKEIDDLLDARSVSLPVLKDGEVFPYDALWQARDTVAGRQFREVVAKRDARPNAKLIEDYIATLNQRLGDTLMARTVRFLVPAAVGLAHPVVGLAVGALDVAVVGKLLERGDARFFIDDKLRRLGKA
jgi:hypothetical protein